jgi:hypothetical protein
LLNDFAKAVAKYCDAARAPLVVELDVGPALKPIKRTIFPSTRVPARTAAVKRVCEASQLT